MNRIAEYRNKAKVSQATLAKTVGGIVTSTIGNYEYGIRKIDVLTAQKIVKALNELGANCSFEDVFPYPQSNINPCFKKA